ncbi:hypothetical protein HYH03_014391 [Edaphochlamys debaryana]|uniref:Copper homeostasis protein cutC homolog n=1 Tax=Edaphochlamys debaryana TaxID=47281 RepID=A0A835XN98_9CHLO|nr:hypothetical protein HYH03_014391 [Edaphochlamys debaryana]|eukprot:KAG2487021.1 hypothetical protein HYH03_014391 [Edaphochlamys debaryana]
MLLEVCIDSAHGAAAAQAGGAQRVELCSALVEGGISPSAGLVKACRAAFSGALMVMVRPRGGDFLFSEEEQQVMLEDIRQAKALGADGVVFGALRADGTVDASATERLWSQAKQLGLDATFHRAFDMTPDLPQALDTLVRLGIPRVLTSGGEPTALQGAGTLAALCTQAAGRIRVLAGGGVAPDMAAELVRLTGVTEIHSAAKRRHASAMTYRRPGMSMCSPHPPKDYEWNTTDADTVRALLNAVKGG